MDIIVLPILFFLALIFVYFFAKGTAGILSDVEVEQAIKQNHSLQRPIKLKPDQPKEVAVVHCLTDNNSNDFIYIGEKNCALADEFCGGYKSCKQDCLEYGDCAKTCNNQALIIDDGQPVVDAQKCNACGNCVKACPRGLIRLESKKNRSALQR